MTIKTIYTLVLTFALTMLSITTVQAENCETIQFERGHSSVVIEGTASPDGIICYEITTGDGQTADIAISGANMMFSIDGVTDAQYQYQFTTANKTYAIRVGQLMRSVTDQAYTLTISIH
ncbi:MAG: hypothetical protein KDF59_11685 [Nitrosomonas sp.]|nr:hypothetical protein [Nitrosomonas sp.]